jgi:uncharacterized membrane protein YfhO
VTANRAAAVVLKVSAHGRWRATVDGAAAPIAVVAPGFMAVDVPAGSHRVEFTYDAVSGWETLAWFALGAVVLGAIVVIDQRTREVDVPASGFAVRRRRTGAPIAERSE